MFLLSHTSPSTTSGSYKIRPFCLTIRGGIIVPAQRLELVSYSCVAIPSPRHSGLTIVNEISVRPKVICPSGPHPPVSSVLKKKTVSRSFHSQTEGKRVRKKRGKHYTRNRTKTYRRVGGEFRGPVYGGILRSLE